jgi:histidinol dehydrogenase
MKGYPGNLEGFGGALAATAGTVFLGQAAAVAYGDYITGANHVLPTGGLALSFSSLSTFTAQVPLGTERTP